MRIVNNKTQESFAVRVHGKKPSYFDSSEARRTVTLNGKQADLVLHPKKETGNRVNFASPKGDTWYYVDNDALAALVRQKGNAKLEFVTAEGRAPKAEAKATPEAAPKAAAAK